VHSLPASELAVGPRWGPADRLQDRLGELLGRFELLMSRAGQATNPAHDEPKDTDSD
jgi:hypothetical protein